jgi:hypothetical protein
MPTTATIAAAQPVPYKDTEVMMILEGERAGLVRPELDKNGRWIWVVVRPCKIVDGALVPA